MHVVPNEERENLQQIGGCLRYLQPGHIANECPRSTQVANIAILVSLARKPTRPVIGKKAAHGACPGLAETQT
jgi:hypothetical protein